MIKFKDQILVEDTGEGWYYSILSSTDGLVSEPYRHLPEIIDMAEYSSTPPAIIISFDNIRYIYIYLHDSIFSITIKPTGNIKILWESEDHLVRRTLERILT